MRHTSVCYILSALVGLTVGQSALAADFPSDLRGGYTEQGWEDSSFEGVGLTTGVRYWYAKGGQNVESFGESFTSNDTTHFGELYLRVDDDYTKSFVNLVGGYSALINGTYSNSADGVTDAAITDGKVAYFMGDFGYMPIHFEDGDNSGGLGLIAGYQYWNDSPDMGRGNFATIDSAADVSWDVGTGEPIYGGDSTVNNLDVNALRLGVVGEADMGAFHISAEAAAIPYAQVNGTLAARIVPTTDFGTYQVTQSGPTEFSGNGYGGTAQVMVGTSFDNWNFNVGGRAWYLEARGEARYEVATVTDGVDSEPDGTYETDGTVALQNYVTDLQAFSMWRYGILAELSYSF